MAGIFYKKSVENQGVHIINYMQKKFKKILKIFA